MRDNESLNVLVEVFQMFDNFLKIFLLQFVLGKLESVVSSVEHDDSNQKSLPENCKTGIVIELIDMIFEKS